MFNEFEFSSKIICNNIIVKTCFPIDDNLKSLKSIYDKVKSLYKDFTNVYILKICYRYCFVIKSSLKEGEFVMERINIIDVNRLYNYCLKLFPETLEENDYKIVNIYGEINYSISARTRILSDEFCYSFQTNKFNSNFDLSNLFSKKRIKNKFNENCEVIREHYFLSNLEALRKYDFDFCEKQSYLIKFNNADVKVHKYTISTGCLCNCPNCNGILYEYYTHVNLEFDRFEKINF